METETMVAHEHNKRIGRCLYDGLDDITYDNPTMQTMCLAPLVANLSILDVNNRLSLTKWDTLRFSHNCPFIRGTGLHLHENGLVSPDDDEFPNIYSKILEAVLNARKTANPGWHLKVVTLESDVYVYNSVSDQKQFIENIRNLQHPIMERIIGVSKVSISHPTESLKDVSIGDSLELLTMRLRQRTCLICHDDTDNVLSDRKITCLPCSHLYHEDCITLWLMRKSTCPCCEYIISFDEVECKLPCDWPRRQRRSRSNMCKTVERLTYRIQGSWLNDTIWLLKRVVLLQFIVSVYHEMSRHDLKWNYAKYEMARKAEEEKH